MDYESLWIKKVLRIIEKDGEELELNLVRIMNCMVRSKKSVENNIISKVLIIINSILNCDYVKYYSLKKGNQSELKKILFQEVKNN